MNQDVDMEDKNNLDDEKLDIQDQPETENNSDDEKDPSMTAIFYSALFPHFADVDECAQVTEALLHYYAYPLSVSGERLLYHVSGAILQCEINIEIPFDDQVWELEPRRFRMNHVNDVAQMFYAPQYTNIILCREIFEDIVVSDEPIPANLQQNPNDDGDHWALFDPGFTGMNYRNHDSWDHMVVWAEHQLSIA